MNVAYTDILFQEVPDEISLGIAFTGCPQKCSGCHSPEFRDPNYGKSFTINDLTKQIEEYRGLITCVCFLGGDWNEAELLSFALEAKKYKLKICLYTGQKTVSSSILRQFDFIKIGEYKKELGGLESPTTNQRFYEIKDGEFVDTTFKFKRSEWKD